MSERRLTYVILMNNYYQIREVDDDGYCRRLAPTGIIDLLNEQQATIQSLKEENDDLRFALRTEQAFTRVEKDKKPFLSKEEFLKELEEDE